MCVCVCLSIGRSLRRLQRPVSIRARGSGLRFRGNVDTQGRRSRSGRASAAAAAALGSGVVWRQGLARIRDTNRHVDKRVPFGASMRGRRVLSGAAVHGGAGGTAGDRPAQGRRAHQEDILFADQGAGVCALHHAGERAGDGGAQLERVSTLSDGVLQRVARRQVHPGGGDDACGRRRHAVQCVAPARGGAAQTTGGVYRHRLRRAPHGAARRPDALAQRAHRTRPAGARTVAARLAPYYVRVQAVQAGVSKVGPPDHGGGVGSKVRPAQHVCALSPQAGVLDGRVDPHDHRRHSTDGGRDRRIDPPKVRALAQVWRHARRHRLGSGRWRERLVASRRQSIAQSEHVGGQGERGGYARGTPVR
eukprot:ctg_1139.g383